MKFIKEDTMALIIDYQEKLMPAIKDSEILIENSKKLIEGLQVLNIPMSITQQYTKGLGMTVEPIKSLFPQPFVYHEKISFSGYQDEDTRESIQDINRKNVIVCGAEAHICVLQTVIDLIDAGYDVILPIDCIGSRKDKDYEAAIVRAQKEGAYISSYETILFELLGQAGTEEFKAVSRIIK